MLVRFRHVFFCLVGVFALNHNFIFSMEPAVVPNSRQATAGEPVAGYDEVSSALSRMSLGSQQACQPHGPYNGILFFDWDDTVCPSSELCKHTSNRCDVPCAAFPADLRNSLVQIDGVVKQIIFNIRAAVFFTCIVTRAEAAWVTLSSRAYLPQVHNLINAGLLPVYSAHGSPLGKGHIFAEQIERIQQARAQRQDFPIIALGDDETDRSSFLHSCSGVQQAFSMSIKLISKPRADQVRMQLAFLMMNLSRIMSVKKNLDLTLEFCNQAK